MHMDTSTASTGAGWPNTALTAAVDEVLILAEEQGVCAVDAFLTTASACFALTCWVLAEPAR
jgi:hypothetical protein